MHALQPLSPALLATLRDMAPILATVALFLLAGTGRLAGRPAGSAGRVDRDPDRSHAAGAQAGGETRGCGCSGAHIQCGLL